MKLLVLGDFQGRFSAKLAKKIEKEEFNAIVGVGDYAGISDFRPWVMKNITESKKGNPYITPEEYFGKKKWKQLMKKDDDAAKEVLIKIKKLGKPFFSVFGNGDGAWYSYAFAKKRKAKERKKEKMFLRRITNLSDITYSQKKFRNLNFIGFGGYMDIEAFLDKKKFKAKDENIKVILKRLKDGKKNFFSRLNKLGKNKIFVLHYPPLGVFDIIRDKKDNPMNGKSAGVRFFREAIKKYKPKLVFCGHMHEYQGIKKIGNSFVINPGDAEKDKYALVEFDDDKVQAKFVK